jgi:hypothetical protein
LRQRRGGPPELSLKPLDGGGCPPVGAAVVQDEHEFADQKVKPLQQLGRRRDALLRRRSLPFQSRQLPGGHPQQPEQFRLRETATSGGRYGARCPADLFDDLIPEAPHFPPQGSFTLRLLLALCRAGLSRTRIQIPDKVGHQRADW